MGVDPLTLCNINAFHLKASSGFADWEVTERGE